MRAADAVLNLALGYAYLGVGYMVVVDMKRGWRRFGFSRFGAAMIGLAITCGPHHLFHGIHVALEGRAGGPMHLAAVAVGVPVAAAWLILRIEAFRGGRGDRLIQGTPWWLGVIPTISGAYIATMVAAMVATDTGSLRWNAGIVANLILVVLYAVIGVLLLRTQFRNRAENGGWSVSGLTFSAIFPTCSVMHAVWAFYVAAGVYDFDVHAFAIDWLSVPAAIYFLHVTRALQKETIHDWNEDPSTPTYTMDARAEGSVAFDWLLEPPATLLETERQESA